MIAVPDHYVGHLLAPHLVAAKWSISASIILHRPCPRISLPLKYLLFEAKWIHALFEYWDKDLRHSWVMIEWRRQRIAKSKLFILPSGRWPPLLGII